MLSFAVRVLFFACGVAAVANYAPVPSITPAPSTYGSPYGNYPAYLQQGQVAPQAAQPFQNFGNAGVPEYLPSVSGNVQPAGNTLPTVVPQVVPSASFAQSPLGVSVPVNQPVGFSQQVTVTNPQQHQQQGYAPVPQIAPASSAYGTQSSGYGSYSAYGGYQQHQQQQQQQFQQQQQQQQLQNQNQNRGNNFQQTGFQSPAAAQPIGLNNGFTQTNGLVEQAVEVPDTWAGVNTARGVKTQKTKSANLKA